MKTCENCGHTMDDHKHNVFCAKCGTKFPATLPEALYYCPKDKRPYTLSDMLAEDVWDTVKYVQAEEAEFLKRQVASQAAVIGKLQDESPKYNGELKKAQKHTEYWRALYYSVSERTNWFTSEDVRGQFRSQRMGGI